MEEDKTKYQSQWTIEGFNKRFEELIKMPAYDTYEKAYYQAEIEHIALFGKVRYKNYDSFRDSRRSYVFKR